MAGVVKEQSAQLAGVAKERCSSGAPTSKAITTFFLDLDAAKAAAKPDQVREQAEQGQ